MTPRWPAPRPRLSPEVLLEPLLRRHPEVWAVLVRHGLAPGGGPAPGESLASFATSHHLDPAALRAECSAVLRTRGGDGAAVGATEALYRAYVLGALALALLTGAAWSAWLVPRLGTGRPLGPLDEPAVQVHAELQVYGWVGLLCMGLAYATLPRAWRAPLAAPRLAGVVLGLMLAALAARAAGLAAGPGEASWLVGSGAAGLQVVAVGLFAGQLAATWRRGPNRAGPVAGFLACGLAWLVASSALSAVFTSRGLAAGGPEELAALAARMREPLRDMQVHGLALVLSLGLALRALPGYFGLPAAGDRRAWWTLDLMTTAVLAELVLSPALGRTGHPAFAVGLMVSWLMLAGGVASLVVAWRPWRPMPGAGPCAAFVRAAFAWLALALGLLVLQPAADALAGRPVGASHDAARHALAAGYLTVLLMGVATRVAVVRAGREDPAVPGLPAAFWLVNAAVALRLLGLAVGARTPAGGALVGLAAPVQVAGLVAWGLALRRLWRGAGVVSA
jgi:hypothetical protein